MGFIKISTKPETFFFFHNIYILQNVTEIKVNVQATNKSEAYFG